MDSLTALRKCVSDAMKSGVTSQEIYDTINDEISPQKVPSWDELIKEGYEYTPLIPKKS